MRFRLWNGLACLTVAALSQTVKDDRTPLKTGCAESSESLATLAKGTSVRLRYALAGAPRPCWAVTVDVNGKPVQGYLWTDALAGLEKVEAERRRASSSVSIGAATRQQVEIPRETLREGARDSVQKSKYAVASDVYKAMDALESGRTAEVEQILSRPGVPTDQRDVALVRATALVELNQPDRALMVLEAALRKNPRDPQLLALAGMAAYKMDDPRTARRYWQEAQEAEPSQRVENMLKRLERETGADQSNQKSYGSRFVLRYDGAVADPETARRLVEALEQEYSRVAGQLGCRAEERIPTIVQTKQAYRTASGAAEWSGGEYDGRIRVPMERAKVLDPATRQTLAHEIVHACLASLGRWPAWFHEGVAQKLSGETLHPVAKTMLRDLARAGKLPKLSELPPGWAGLNAMEARLCYALALAAADELFRVQGALAARNLVNNPERLPQVAADLDRAVAASLQ